MAFALARREEPQNALGWTVQARARARRVMSARSARARLLTCAVCSLCVRELAQTALLGYPSLKLLQRRYAGGGRSR